MVRRKLNLMGGDLDQLFLCTGRVETKVVKNVIPPLDLTFLRFRNKVKREVVNDRYSALRTLKENLMNVRVHFDVLASTSEFGVTVVLMSYLDHSRSGRMGVEHKAVLSQHYVRCLPTHLLKHI